MAESSPGILQRVGRFFRFSLAVWAAITVGTILLGVTLLAWIIYSLDPSRVAWGSYLTWEQAGALIALWASSCVLTYWTVRLWMQQPPIRDRALRRSWDYGRTWLSTHSAGLSNLPVYVVIGCWSRHLQSQVFAEGEHAPEPSDAHDLPIDWHLNEEGIFLLLRDCGVYNRLLRKIRDQATQCETSHSEGPALAPAPNLSPAPYSSERVDTASSDGEETKEVAAQGESGSSEQDGSTEPALEASTENPDLRSTAADKPQSRADATTASPESSNLQPSSSIAGPKVATRTLSPKNAESQTAAPVFRTLDRVEGLVARATSELSERSHLHAEAMVPKSDTQLTSIERNQAQARLTSLCTLLKSARHPAASLNGTLVVVDPAQIHDDGAARELGRALRSDVEQMTAELGLISPVTTLVASAQDSADFSELARRHQNGQRLRLGKAFDAQQIPSAKAVSQLVDDALGDTCRRIEYVLGQPSALTQPNNHRLVRLAIRCRSWRLRLQWLLVEGLASFDSDRDDPGIVSGVYLSGTGNKGRLGNWVQGVLQHMHAEQHHLMWTASELRVQRRNRLLQVSLIIATVMLVALLLLQWFR